MLTKLSLINVHATMLASKQSPGRNVVRFFTINILNFNKNLLKLQNVSELKEHLVNQTEEAITDGHSNHRQ